MEKRTPLCLTWLDSDVDESFTVVESRKSRRSKGRGNIVVNKPMTRNKKKAGTSTDPPCRPVRQRNIPVRFK